MAARATPASDQSRCAELPTNRSGGMPYSSLARGLASRMTPLRGSMTMSASVTLSNRSRYPRSTLRNSSSAGFCSMTRPRSAQARAMPARSVSSGGSEAPEKNSTAASVRRCATAGKANTAAAPSSGSGRHCGAPSRSTLPASPSPRARRRRSAMRRRVESRSGRSRCQTMWEDISPACSENSTRPACQPVAAQMRWSAALSASSRLPARCAASRTERRSWGSRGVGTDQARHRVGVGRKGPDVGQLRRASPLVQ